MSIQPAVLKSQYDATVKFVHEFMAAGDCLNPRPWIERFFTFDAKLLQPGRSPVQGHEAIVALLTVHQGTLQSIKHTIKHIDVLPERVYVEASVEWVIKGDPEGKVIVGRGLGVLDKKAEESRVSRFDVFGDFSELRKRYQEVHGIHCD